MNDGCGSVCELRLSQLRHLDLLALVFELNLKPDPGTRLDLASRDRLLDMLTRQDVTLTLKLHAERRLELDEC